MNVSNLEGQQLLDLAAKVMGSHASIDTVFWYMENAGCRHIPAKELKTKMPPGNCIGKGSYEATVKNCVARGTSHQEAIMRVIVYSKFGSTV